MRILQSPPFIGFCSILETELWGVWCGLQLAWEKGCRRIILEVDSLEVVKALQEDCRQGHICSLLFHIRLFLQRNWEVHVVHVLRRANSIADRLAKLAISGSNCVTYLANPPPSIVPILQDDIASHLVSYGPLYINRRIESSFMVAGTCRNKNKRFNIGAKKANGDEDDTEGEECNVVVWDTLSTSFKMAQAVLDRNRELIQKVNENHQSKIPDNLKMLVNAKGTGTGRWKTGALELNSTADFLVCLVMLAADRRIRVFVCKFHSTLEFIWRRIEGW
ncbi:hypothetical protein GQ457_07G042280 [Hibiscus cannabinus]